MSNDVPTPSNVLRGHKAQVHTAAFVRENERLVTADADGYVVVWNLAIMRPAAIWKAHEKPILGVQGWGRDKLITHGRDHKLIVWKLGEKEEQGLDVFLPVEHSAQAHRKPWILHLVEVNALNFCSFAACARRDGDIIHGPDASADILVAVPNALAIEAVDILAMPSQSRFYTIRSNAKVGLVMSLRLLHHAARLTLLSGFEDGSASVQRLDSAGTWISTYSCRAHSQPVLSLDLGPGQDCFYSSSADSIIAQHPIPIAQQSLTQHQTDDGQAADQSEPGRSRANPSAASMTGSTKSAERLQPWKHPLKTINTKHSGQQSLQVRSDSKIFATAGWDSNVRVYSASTLKELAVLQWHKVGAYAVAFADVATSKAGNSPSANVRVPPESATVLPADAAAGPLLGVPEPISKSIVGVKEERIRRARTTHWVVAGAKDGKVSLWSIY